MVTDEASASDPYAAVSVISGATRSGPAPTSRAATRWRLPTARTRSSAMSRYVNELYDDIPSGGGPGAGRRGARAVTVGETTANIDFALVMADRTGAGDQRSGAPLPDVRCSPLRLCDDRRLRELHDHERAARAVPDQHVERRRPPDENYDDAPSEIRALPVTVVTGETLTADFASSGWPDLGHGDGRSTAFRCRRTPSDLRRNGSSVTTAPPTSTCLHERDGLRRTLLRPHREQPRLHRRVRRRGRVSVERAGCLPRVGTEIEVTAGATRTASISPSRRRRIAGRFVDATTGAPASGSSWSSTARTGWWRRPRRTAAARTSRTRVCRLNYYLVGEDPRTFR